MKNIARFIPVTAVLSAALLLSACVAPVPVYQQARYPYQPPPQAQPYPYGATAPSGYVEYGRVANIEVMQSQGAAGTTGGGAVAGGVIGGVVGNQIGRGSGRAAATALGIVGGALLGNTIEGHNTAPRVYQSYRISVQTDNGGYRAFDVPNPGDLRMGDRVRIDNGQLSRY